MCSEQDQRDHRGQDLGQGMIPDAHNIINLKHKVYDKNQKRMMRCISATSPGWKKTSIHLLLVTLLSIFSLFFSGGQRNPTI